MVSALSVIARIGLIAARNPCDRTTYTAVVPPSTRIEVPVM